MKKLLFTLIISSASLAFASSIKDVNFTKDSISCSNTKITLKTTIEEISKCKITSHVTKKMISKPETDDIRDGDEAIDDFNTSSYVLNKFIFTNDKGNLTACYFHDAKLDHCKVKIN